MNIKYKYTTVLQQLSLCRINRGLFHLRELRSISSREIFFESLAIARTFRPVDWEGGSKTMDTGWNVARWCYNGFDLIIQRLDPLLVETKGNNAQKNRTLWRSERLVGALLLKERSSASSTFRILYGKIKAKGDEIPKRNRFRGASIFPKKSVGNDGSACELSRTGRSHEIHDGGGLPRNTFKTLERLEATTRRCFHPKSACNVA